MASYCAHCGTPMREGARFCHRCGAARDGSAPPAARPPGAGVAPAANALLPWAIAGIAMLSLLGFIVGSQWRRTPPTAAAPFADAAAGGRAPDISRMSPQERADRLFDRVMTYVSAGKSDSVLFFAPMAIQSFEALAPLDAHRRYDLGLLGVVSGDDVLARAQADSILLGQPSHLLGLILGMRAAGLQRDTVARRGYAERFLASLTSERAKRLPEYADHEPDIEAAIREAEEGRPVNVPNGSAR